MQITRATTRQFHNKFHCTTRYFSTTTTPKALHTSTATASPVETTIKFISINNPAKRNALSLKVLEDLYNQFNDVLRGDVPHVPKVVVLQSEGPVFCSGHDLKELSANTSDFHKRTFHICGELMKLIKVVPQPVIAKVQGLATAAGCQLVAACDLAVASKSAQFATPGVKIGLFCTTPGIEVARAISHKKAMEMLLTGEPISAEEALQHGLINKVVSPDQLDTVTLEMATSIAKASFETIRLGKKAFYKQVELELDHAYTYGTDVMVENIGLDDCVEGISAFVQKRHPKWKY